MNGIIISKPARYAVCSNENIMGCCKLQALSQMEERKSKFYSLIRRKAKK